MDRRVHPTPPGPKATNNISCTPKNMMHPGSTHMSCPTPCTREICRFPTVTPSVHGEFYMTGPCLPAHVIPRARRSVNIAAQAKLCAVALPPCSRVYVARLAKGSSVATHPVGLRPSLHDWAMPAGSCRPHAPQIRPPRRPGQTLRRCTATLLSGICGTPRKSVIRGAPPRRSTAIST